MVKPMLDYAMLNNVKWKKAGVAENIRSPLKM